MVAISKNVRVVQTRKSKVYTFEEYLRREEKTLWRIKKHTDPNGTIALRSLGVTISMTEVYEHIEFVK